MNQVLQPFLNKFIVVYYYDILVCGKSVEDHLQHPRSLFQALVEGELVINHKKSLFLVKEISFLGFLIGQGQIKMDPRKVEVVQ